MASSSDRHQRSTQYETSGPSDRQRCDAIGSFLRKHGLIKKGEMVQTEYAPNGRHTTRLFRERAFSKN